ncbi:MAG: DNA gyrase inhibitor YacG [Terriglobia bacterium]
MKWHCPICRRPTDSTTDADFPFCCARCRLIDLGHWAAADYRISEPAPGETEPELPVPLHDEDHSGS